MLTAEEFYKLTTAEWNQLTLKKLAEYHLSRCFMEESDIKIVMETLLEDDRENFEKTVHEEHAKVKERMQNVFEKALTWLRSNRPQARAIPVVEVSISYISEMKWI